MPHAALGDVTVYYEDHGDGDPILLLHAFPLSSAMWAPQSNALGAGFRLVAPDARGFGQSRPVPEVLTMQQIAEDAARLLDHLGIDRCVVGGLSMGGYATLAFWHHHRSRVRALILADTRAVADTADGRASRLAFVDSTQQRGMPWVADEMAPRLQRAEPVPKVDECLRGLMLKNSCDAIVAAQLGMAERPDRLEALSAIDCPVLVLVGSQDSLTPPAESEKMVAQLPNAQLVELPEAGHMANLEAPEPFNRAVEQFMGTLSDP